MRFNFLMSKNKIARDPNHRRSQIKVLTEINLLSTRCHYGNISRQLYMHYHKFYFFSPCENAYNHPKLFTFQQEISLNYLTNISTRKFQLFSQNSFLITMNI